MLCNYSLLLLRLAVPCSEGEKWQLEVNTMKRNRLGIRVKTLNRYHWISTASGLGTATHTVLSFSATSACLYTTTKSAWDNTIIRYHRLSTAPRLGPTTHAVLSYSTTSSCPCASALLSSAERAGRWQGHGRPPWLGPPCLWAAGERRPRAGSSAAPCCKNCLCAEWRGWTRQRCCCCCCWTAGCWAWSARWWSDWWWSGRRGRLWKPAGGEGAERGNRSGTRCEGVAWTGAARKQK